MDKIRIPHIEHLLPGTPANVSREVIAHHEAGHVLVSHYYRREVLRATLDDTGGQGPRNHVQFQPNRALESLLQCRGDPRQLWPEALCQTQVTVRILFGGPAAQALHQRVPFEQVDGGEDYRMAIRSLLLLEALRLRFRELADVDSRHRQPEALDQLAADARRVVGHDDHRPYLTRIADRLLQGGAIERNEIRLLLAGMPTADPTQAVRRQLLKPSRRDY